MIYSWYFKRNNTHALRSFICYYLY